MIKRIAILAAAFLMLIAAGRNDYDRELQTNDSRAIEGRSAGSERSERADREYPARSDRSTGSTGYDEDAAGSASERVLQRITPVEVTYDISGTTAEVPEGSDPEGDDLDETEVHEGTEPEEGGADAAITSDSGEDVDGYTGEDLGADNGDEQAAGGTEQPDPGEEQPSSDLEPAGDDESAADDSWEAEVEEPVPEPEWTYYGNCRITFYCTGPCCCGEWSGGPTASGEEPIPYWTCANGDLPFGTHVLIDGVEYCVTDRGVAGDEFDVLVGSHDEALARGLYYTDVYVRWKE